MSIVWDRFLEQTLNGYQSSYDIDRVTDSENGLVAKAHFHVTESQTFMFKEVQMWSADSDEYAYFFHFDKLSAENAQACIDYVCEVGQPMIQLNHLSFRRQHMCTRLVAVMIADEMDEEAARVIKKSKIYKSFQFSLKGWMEVHAVAADLGKESVISNRYGKETAKFLKKVISSFRK